MKLRSRQKRSILNGLSDAIFESSQKHFFGIDGFINDVCQNISRRMDRKKSLDYEIKTAKNFEMDNVCFYVVAHLKIDPMKERYFVSRVVPRAMVQGWQQ